MLEVELEQIVWLCHHTLPPRQAEVVEVTHESCRVIFLTTSGIVSFANFSLITEYNDGNNAYWIQTELTD